MLKKSNEITKDKIIRLIILLPVGIFILWFFFRGIYHISYWIWYKPAYTVFGDNLYLPFVLYIIRYLSLPTVLLIFFLVKLKKWYKTIPVIIMILMVCIFGRNVFKDIIFIHNAKYAVEEFNISSLRKSHIKSRPIYIMNQGVYTKTVEMDIYQYNRLILQKEKTENDKISVYFLPNTRIMLKYFIDE